MGGVSAHPEHPPQDDEPLRMPARPSVRRRLQIVHAAAQAGHVLDVEHASKRFALVCSCGFRTPLGWTRKHAFDAGTDHVIRAGRTALGETPLLGQIGPAGEDQAAEDTGVSLPAPGKINL